MKNLTDIIRTGEMTPRQRFLLLVQDDVNKDKTGKHKLTDSDRYAISDGWKPKDNFEAREYNRLCEAWRVEGNLRASLQIHFLDTQVKLLRSSKIVDFAMWTEFKRFNNFQAQFEVDNEKSLSAILRHSGLDYNRVIYSLTFQNLPANVKEDILSLFPDAKTEIDYINEETILYKYFKDNKTLNQEEIQSLATEMVNQIPWDYIDFLIKRERDVFDMLFKGYFAGLPLLQIVKKWASINGISYTDDKELKLKISKEKNLKSIFKETIIKYLEDGLFVKEYVPLCNSTSTATCNDKPTSLTHKEVITAWVEENIKVRKLLESLVDSGKLVLENRERTILTITKKYTMITGESLYFSTENLPFITDFKKQIDDLSCFGRLIQFLKERKFIEQISEIQLYKKIYQKLSKLFEVDFSYITDPMEKDFFKYCS
jgi:hypothetical protein